MVPGEGQSENEKSFVDWIRHSIAFAFIFPCLVVVWVFFRYEGAWTAWLSLFFSRGIYLVLATLIFGCFLINLFSKKIQNAVGPSEVRSEDTWCSPNNLWKAPLLPSCNELTVRKSFSAEDSCGTDAAKQMLREADVRNEALKRELEELHKARLALEERSGQLEREKATIEERLEETKFQSALENESLRKEAAIAQRQLQQVVEENEMLSREVSSVSREARITDSALKDQARLTTRLEEARAELNRLKLQIEEMKVERDTAVAIAADLAVRAQGAADDSAQLIGQWVKREMENRKNKFNEPSTLTIVAAEPEPLPIEVPVVTGELQEDDVEKVRVEVLHETTEIQNNQDHCHTWEEEEPEECIQGIGWGPVTSSAAFRDFLNTNYSQLPL